MAQSNPVSAGNDILASAYNNLRDDVLHSGLGHIHSGAANGGRQIPVTSLDFNVATQAELDATMNTTTGHDHDGVDSKLLASGEYGARAVKTEDQDIPDTAFGTLVTFPTETFDIQGEFANSRYTATMAGYYQVTSALKVIPAGNMHMKMHIRKDGEYAYSIIQNYVYATNGASMLISDLVYLAVASYIEIWVEFPGSTGVVKGVDSFQNYFSIMKIKSVA